MPPFDFQNMPNPAIPGTFGTGPQAPSPQGQFGGGDFSGQLNDMLAPYRQMAQQFQSPYATMNQNSWLARNHPQFAGHLDNAFLNIGMTPGPQGPEGVGGGLSRAMQGIMGGQQFQRQRMMQQAMLPYQMLQPQLQAQDMMAQITARKSEALREQDYHELVTGRTSRMAEQSQLEGQKLQQQQQRIDSFVNPSMLDHRRALLKAGLPTDADINQASPEQLEKYNKAFSDFQDERARGRGNSGTITQGSLAGAMTPRLPNESESDWANRVGQNWMRLGGGAAGAKTGAETAITSPIQDVKTFIAKEDSNAYRDILKVESFEDFKSKSGFLGKIAELDPVSMGQLHKEYDKSQTDYQSSLAKRDTEVAQWKRSSAPSQGIGFFEWKTNPGIYKGTASQSAPTTAPSGKQTSGPNSQWNP